MSVIFTKQVDLTSASAPVPSLSSLLLTELICPFCQVALLLMAIIIIITIIMSVIITIIMYRRTWHHLGRSGNAERVTVFVRSVGQDLTCR